MDITITNPINVHTRNNRVGQGVVADKDAQGEELSE